MTAKATTISPENITAITYKTHPVVTTGQLASLYGTSLTNITSNISRNKNRFSEGKHYYSVTGSELKEIKDRVTQSDSVAIKPNVNKLTLWTERGAARHAKMLDTDQAWDVFERLEECYFNSYPATTHQDTQPISPAQQREIQELVSEAVKNCTNGYKGDYARVYGSIKSRFKVGSYKDLPACRFDEVVSFLRGYGVPERLQFDMSGDVDPIIRQMLDRCPVGSLGAVMTILGAISMRIPYKVTVSFPEEGLERTDSFLPSV